MPQSTSSSPRTGVSGLDVFKIAGESISGYVSSLKTGEPRVHRLPCTTKMEQRLAMYLEYHPHVRLYQRGDASKAFVQAHHIPAPLGTPYNISYTYDGAPHEYLPDFVGTLCDGGLLVAEAGIEQEKSKGKPVAKAEAAHRLVQLKGGVYWIGTEKNLPLSRHYNLVYLHSKRDSFKTYSEIAEAILAQWPWGSLRTVHDFLRLFSRRWSEAEVEAAVWKLVGDAAARGHLLVDLTAVELSRATPLALLGPDDPPILPDTLPSSLEDAESEQDENVTSSEEESDSLLEPQNMIPGPTFDGSSLKTREQQTRFERNLAAVSEVLQGESFEKVAKQNRMAISTLWRMTKRARQLGQIACAPRQTYKRESTVRIEFQQLIRKLYTHPIRPTVKAVSEDYRLKDLAEELGKREKVAVSLPSYTQVWRFIRSIEREGLVAHARSGLKHQPRERMSPYSFVLSIPFPALICQVDEHTLDTLIVAQDGTVITRRVHAAVLVCVKTGAILSAVLGLDSLKEEDYMRLVKQAMEPKNRLVTLYECQHSWSCFGKPAIIFHDRGKIFTSERATQVLVDRFKIITEQAPPYAPSAKGTVEAIFTWTTRKFEHRLPGTTKSHPNERGAYDSVREAEKAGITLDLLEKYFIQAIVDDYMQDWNKLRRQRPHVLWEQAVEEKGVPQWMGPKDDLKLLLMKAQNRKNKATGRYAVLPYQGISFLGRRYVNESVLNQLRGKEIDIYYDRRDISVIYLFLNGSLVGEAYCTEFMGRRVSVWEASSMRKADKKQEREANLESLEGRQRVHRNAQASRKAKAAEIRRLEQQRRMDQQRHEIHPEQVQATLAALTQYAVSPTPVPQPPKISTFSPLPEPEDDTQETPVVYLKIRNWEE